MSATESLNSLAGKCEDIVFGKSTHPENRSFLIDTDNSVSRTDTECGTTGLPTPSTRCSMSQGLALAALKLREEQLRHEIGELEARVLEHRHASTTRRPAKKTRCPTKKRKRTANPDTISRLHALNAQRDTGTKPLWVTRFMFLTHARVQPFFCLVSLQKCVGAPCQRPPT